MYNYVSNIFGSAEAPILSEKWLQKADQQAVNLAVRKEAQAKAIPKKQIVETLAKQPRVASNPHILLKLAASCSTKRSWPLSKLCNCTKPFFIEQLKKMSESDKRAWFRHSVGDPNAAEALLQTGWAPSDHLLSEVLGRDLALLHLTSLDRGRSFDSVSNLNEQSMLFRTSLILAKWSLPDAVDFLERFKIANSNNIRKIILMKLKRNGWPQSVADTETMFKYVKMLSKEHLKECLSEYANYQSAYMKYKTSSSKNAKHFLKILTPTDSIEAEMRIHLLKEYVKNVPKSFFNDFGLIHGELTSEEQMIALSFAPTPIPMPVFEELGLPQKKDGLLLRLSFEKGCHKCFFGYLINYGLTNEKIVDVLVKASKFIQMDEILGSQLLDFEIKSKIISTFSLEKQVAALKKYPSDEIEKYLNILPLKNRQEVALYILKEKGSLPWLQKSYFDFLSPDLVESVIACIGAKPPAKSEVVQPLLKSILGFRERQLKIDYLHLLLTRFGKEPVFFERVSQRTEREQLVAINFVYCFPNNQLFSTTEVSLVESILDSINKLKILKDGAQLRAFLQTLEAILLLPSPEWLTKLTILDARLKITAGPSKAAYASTMKLLSQLHLLLDFPHKDVQDALQEPTSDLNALVKLVFESIGYSKDQLEPLWATHNKVFSFDPLGPLIFWKGLGKLPEPDKTAAQEGFKILMQQAYDGTFQTERFALEKSPHLQLIFAKRPELLELWKTGSSVALDQLLPPLKPGEKGPNIKGWTVVDSDDLQDLFFMGVVTQSCQRPAGPPKFAKGLLGIMNGRTRMLCVKDASGKVVARALIRILQDTVNHRPVLLLEPIYNGQPTNAFIDTALLELAKTKAQELSLPLVGTKKGVSQEKYLGNAVFEKDKAPFEYSDTGSYGKAYDHNTVLIVGQDSLHAYFMPEKLVAPILEIV